jgi:hypothetical protein
MKECRMTHKMTDRQNDGQRKRWTNKCMNNLRKKQLDGESKGQRNKELANG